MNDPVAASLPERKLPRPRRCAVRQIARTPRITKLQAAALCRCWAIALAWLTLSPGGPAGWAATDAETLFETRVRPTLIGKCVRCHGGEKQSGGLDLRTRAGLLHGGDSGPAVSLEQPKESLLLKAVRRDDDASAMPPDEPLQNDDVAALSQWIAAGAVWPDGAATTLEAGPRHWAFQPLGQTTPPELAGAESHPIDRFIELRRRAAGISPAPPADSAALVRRLYFDLWGLPPSPEQAHAFIADRAPDAWPRLVDRLLAAPQYGERWGRHWLDLARYADTAGDNADYPVPELTLYRDWVIAALNADLPYDEFLHQQVAGDILAREFRGEHYAQRVVATGFLALSRRYATAPYELWHLTLEDAIDTLGRTALGLTMRCARCHDHKYDPLTMRDYYALYGVLASTRFPYAGSEEFQSMNRPRQNFAALVTPAEAAPRWEAYRQQVQALQLQYDAVKAKPAPAGAGDPPSDDKVRNRDEEYRKQQEKRLRGELRLLAGPGAPAGLPVAYAVSEGDVADTAIQKLGEPSQPGEVVPRGVPALFGPMAEPVPAGHSGRLELARWLTGPAAPLTARVMVNRLWQHHFGRGLVGTPSNFGLRGEAPTHPELLDWLALQLIDRGWSLKAIHRLILTSETYRLSTDSDEASRELDPGNLWLGRQNRRRLDAEALRDAALCASGGLDLQQPDPHPFPPIEKWNWTQHAPFRAVYASQSRSVYLLTQRIVRHPYLALFDAPDTNTTSDQRTSATVPLQALFFLNDPWLAQQAETLGGRAMSEATDAPGRIERVMQWAWSRSARPEEMQRWLAYLEQQQALAQQAGMDDDAAQRAAWTSLARVALMANEFVYVD